MMGVEIDARRMRGGGRMGKIKGVGDTLGSGVVSFINGLREQPIPMPKGYKKQIQRPKK